MLGLIIQRVYSNYFKEVYTDTHTSFPLSGRVSVTAVRPPRQSSVPQNNVTPVGATPPQFK